MLRFHICNKMKSKTITLFVDHKAWAVCLAFELYILDTERSSRVTLYYWGNSRFLMDNPNIKTWMSLLVETSKVLAPQLKGTQLLTTQVIPHSQFWFGLQEHQNNCRKSTSTHNAVLVEVSSQLSWLSKLLTYFFTPFCLLTKNGEGLSTNMAVNNALFLSKSCKRRIDRETKNKVFKLIIVYCDQSNYPKISQIWAWEQS